MSYFAKVLKGTVVQVIKADQEFMDSYVDSSPGEWFECFKDGTKKMFPSIGFKYDYDDEIFYLSKFYDSWTLDENYDWQPPTPKPSDGNRYSWDEANQEWSSI